MLISLNELRAVAAFKEVATVVVALVEPAAVAAMEPLDSEPEVRTRGLHEQVNVVAHQAVGQTPPLKLPHHGAQQAEVGQPIAVIDEDALLPVAACKDVV